MCRLKLKFDVKIIEYLRIRKSVRAENARSLNNSVFGSSNQMVYTLLPAPGFQGQKTCYNSGNN